MSVERTLSIIKPDAVSNNVIGEIYTRFERGGLSVIGAKMLHLGREQAEAFYAVHKDRPFYSDLVSFMTSGPVMVQCLEGEDAIQKNRQLMGATNPADAAAGTIRADFASSVDAMTTRPCRSTLLCWEKSLSVHPSCLNGYTSRVSTITQA